MPTVIQRSPVPAAEQTFTLPDRSVIRVGEFQPIVWISVSPPQVISLPTAAPRIPALVDTGFNQTLLIQDLHLLHWCGIDPALLQVAPGTGAKYRDQEWSFRIADIWLHAYPTAPAASQESQPLCLEAQPGILVVSEQQRRQRLPVLGMRALAWNRAALRLEFESPTMGLLSIDAPATA